MLALRASNYPNQERLFFGLLKECYEKGIVTEAGLNAKMAEVRARFDVPPESESPVKKRVRR